MARYSKIELHLTKSPQKMENINDLLWIPFRQWFAAYLEALEQIIQGWLPTMSGEFLVVDSVSGLTWKTIWIPNISSHLDPQKSSLRDHKPRCLQLKPPFPPGGFSPRLGGTRRRSLVIHPFGKPSSTFVRWMHRRGLGWMDRVDEWTWYMWNHRPLRKSTKVP